MKNLIFISLGIFIISLCAFNNDDDSLISKKEMMESWAWKIFIFTDEGEFTPTETVKNNFDDTSKVKPIFAEDVLDIHNKEVLFMNKQKESLKNPVVFGLYAETEAEK